MSAEETVKTAHEAKEVGAVAGHRQTGDSNGCQEGRAAQQAEPNKRGDVAALARRVAADRRFARLPHRWVGDELDAGTGLGIVVAVLAATIVALLYFSAL